jgi:hypothetical protein
LAALFLHHRDIDLGAQILGLDRCGVHVQVLFHGRPGGFIPILINEGEYFAVGGACFFKGPLF